jgi:hypothetical protein
MPRFRRVHVDIRQGSGRPVAPQVTPGAEVFALCQTASAQGRLSRQELKLLQSWIEGQDERQVPSWAYVRGLLEQILATSTVAPPVLQALYRALEPSLPEELRRKRAPLRVVDREYAAPAQLPEAEHLKNEVLRSATFVVAGCQHGRTAAVLERHGREGEPLLLVRDRHSAHSANAVQICVPNGKRIGYVPEEHARDLAPLLDRGARYRAHLVSLMRGKQVWVPVVQTYVYAANATLGIQSGGARRMGSRRSPRVAWALRIGLGLLIAAAVALVLRD